MIRKLSSKRAQVADILLFMFFIILLFFYSMTFISAKQYLYLEEEALEVITKATNEANRVGIFTWDIYNEMKGDLDKLKLDTISINLVSTKSNFTEEEMKYYYKKVVDDDGKNLTNLSKKMNEMTNVSYYYTDTICTRTLRKGDKLTITASSKEPVLFSRLMANWLVIGQRSGAKNIVDVSYTRTITNDGAYLGSQLDTSLKDILKETKTIADKNKYYLANAFEFRGCMYSSATTYAIDVYGSESSEFKIKEFSGKYVTNGSTLDYKDSAGVTQSLSLTTMNVGDLKTVYENDTTPWINPNARYEKFYEPITTLSSDTIYILVIKEVID